MSNFEHVGIQHARGQLYMCAQGSQVKTQTPTQWKLNGRRLMAPPPAYHPAVLFLHLRLLAISFPHEKIRRACQICHYFHLF